MRDLFNVNSNGKTTEVGNFMRAVDQAFDQATLGSTKGEVASMESWSDPAKAETMHSTLLANESFINTLLSNPSNAALESFMESKSEVSHNWLKAAQKRNAIRAAAIAAEVAGDPLKARERVVASMEAARKDTRRADYIADYTNGERAAACGILDHYASLEAFEANNLAKAMSLSVTYNLALAVQDPAIELLYRTVVMSVDEPTVFFEIALDRYHEGWKHDNVRKANRVPEKQMLMAAIRDPRLLQRDVLNVVPFFQDAGEGKNDDLFMPKEIMAKPVERIIAGVAIPTKPLLVGQEYNLLAISNHPGLANGGVFDETDSLDSFIAVDKIYLSLAETDAPNSVVEFPLVGLDRRNFVKSIQGHGQEMDLNFVGTEFTLTKDTLAMDGAAPAALKALTDAGYAVRVEVSLRGTANVESAYYRIQMAEARVVSAVKVDAPTTAGARPTSTPVDLNDSKLAAELKKLKLAVKYFTPEANRTNSNLRTMGVLLDKDVFTSKFAIGIRSPVRYQRRVGSDQESNQDIIEALIRFTRVRQTADGFYELFRYRDTLKHYYNEVMRDNTRIPDFLGVAKYMVKPHYKHIKLNMNEMVKSLDSKDALDNAREFLVGVLQEAAADAITSSEYMIAAVQQNNGQAVTPHFGIICGQYIPLLLSVRGDLRLLGANFEHTIATTYNVQMDEKIFMTFVEKDKDGIQILGFGNTFYYPETVIAVNPHNYNGAIKETFITQPRYQHVTHLPVLIEVDVVGLREYINSYNIIKVEQVQPAKDKDLAPAATNTNPKPAAGGTNGASTAGAGTNGTTP